MNTINTLVFDFYIAFHTGHQSIVTQAENDEYAISITVNEPRRLGIHVNNGVTGALLGMNYF